MRVFAVLPLSTLIYPEFFAGLNHRPHVLDFGDLADAGAGAQDEASAFAGGLS